MSSDMNGPAVVNPQNPLYAGDPPADGTTGGAAQPPADKGDLRQRNGPAVVNPTSPSLADDPMGPTGPALPDKGDLRGAP